MLFNAIKYNFFIVLDFWIFSLNCFWDFWHILMWMVTIWKVVDQFFIVIPFLAIEWRNDNPFTVSPRNFTVRFKNLSLFLPTLYTISFVLIKFTPPNVDIWKTMLKCAQQILTLHKLTHLCTNFVLVILGFLYKISS